MNFTFDDDAGNLFRVSGNIMHITNTRSNDVQQVIIDLRRVGAMALSGARGVRTLTMFVDGDPHSFMVMPETVELIQDAWYKAIGVL